MKTIVVDSEEYCSAAAIYKTVAGEVQAVIGSFIIEIRTLMKSDMSGQTASNMLEFADHMNSALGKAFSELVSSEAKLCKGYCEDVNNADIDKRHVHSTANVKYPRTISFAPINDAKTNNRSIVISNNSAVLGCAVKLKASVDDLQWWIDQTKAIFFSVSKGEVKNINVDIKEETIKVIEDLHYIINACMQVLVGYSITMRSADRQIRDQLNSALTV